MLLGSWPFNGAPQCSLQQTYNETVHVQHRRGIVQAERTLAPPASPAMSSQVVFGGADKAASRRAYNVTYRESEYTVEIGRNKR